MAVERVCRLSPAAATGVTPHVSAQGSALSLVAETVGVNGIDLVAWMTAMQARLQASESATIALAAQHDRVRTVLEASVSELRAQNVQLRATVAALVAEHRQG